MQQIFTDFLYGFTFCSILAVVYMNGFTDAPNAIATSVGTNALSMKNACRLSCVMNVAGVLLSFITKPSVAVTMQKLLYFSDDTKIAVACVCAGMWSVFLWAFAAWFFGIPTSESHSLLAGLAGAVMASETNFSVFNKGEFITVVIGLIVSISIGFLFAAGFYRCLYKYKKHFSSSTLLRLQIVCSALLSFLHGAQDGQKFTGIFLLFQSFVNRNAQQNAGMLPLYVIISALVMGAGSLVGGKRIIQSVGFDMTPLSCLQGVASDLSACLGLAVCTFFGMPVSTTHVKTMSVVGVGFSEKKRNINKNLIIEILLTWLFTFPGCGLLGFLTMRILLTIL